MHADRPGGRRLRHGARGRVAGHGDLKAAVLRGDRAPGGPGRGLGAGLRRLDRGRRGRGGVRPAGGEQHARGRQCDPARPGASRGARPGRTPSSAAVSSCGTAMPACRRAIVARPARPRQRPLTPRGCPSAIICRLWEPAQSGDAARAEAARGMPGCAVTSRVAAIGRAVGKWGRTCSRRFCWSGLLWQGDWNGSRAGCPAAYMAPLVPHTHSRI